MAPPLLLAFFLSAVSLLHQPPFSAANLHKTSSLLRSQLITYTPPQTTTFFEVTKPIKTPQTKPQSYLILQHEFAYTYGKPPILANYNPPPNSQKYSKIVLEWTATCKGKQFDRIFGVWLGGVEILRSCTAEPTKNGIVWTVKKDITRYYSLLMKNQTLAVYLGNIIDETYTGKYHVNVTFHFYPSEENTVNSWADLILPISRNGPLNDGLWFEIENSTDLHSKEFKIPRNSYKAVLEVYVSFHENDEFWFGNYPNEYITANNLTDYPGNGPFREVVISLDDLVIGAVWPFTVIFTGGVNPLFWRPISGIGSFDLPTYNIEITPLLGKLLDGKSHKFGFSVTNALNVWYVDANLHLWLDDKSEFTKGKLLEHIVSPISISLSSKLTGFDGVYVTNVSRSIVSSGWVESSRGKISTKSVQEFEYSNHMEMGNEANLQIFKQIIHLNNSVYTKLPSTSVTSDVSSKKFRVESYSNNIEKGNDSYVSVSNVTLGIYEISEFGTFKSRLKNLQKAKGYMLVKGSSVVEGLGSTKQVYRYIDDDDDKSCYSRNISSSNYTILYDRVGDTCHESRIFRVQKASLNGVI